METKVKLKIKKQAPNYVFGVFFIINQTSYNIGLQPSFPYLDLNN